jgi:hypothetical protein
VCTRCEARVRSHQGEDTASAWMALEPHHRLHAVETKKPPGDAGGEVCVDGGGNEHNRRRAAILARRLRRSKEKAPAAKPGQFWPSRGFGERP